MHDVVALLFGRKGSSLAGKNTHPILGRPCVDYPLMAASDAVTVDATYVSTDCPEIGARARYYDAHIITRPPYLATGDALLEDAIAHAVRAIPDRPSIVVILLANAPCVVGEQIDQATDRLRYAPALDSVVTASEMSAFAPHRARQMTNGALVPMVESLAATCDRKSTGSVYFTDQGLTAVRAGVLFDMDAQPGPFRWQGRHVGLLESVPGGGDIDQPWQFAAAEWWLREHGYEDASLGVVA